MLTHQTTMLVADQRKVLHLMDQHHTSLNLRFQVQAVLELDRHLVAQQQMLHTLTEWVALALLAQMQVRL
jgi:hypothetical protein